MAFVREYVPEKEWELYNSFGLHDEAKHEKMIANEYSGWVADRDREVYLILTGVLGREGIRHYVLIWKGNRVNFTAYSRAVCIGKKITDIQMHYEVYNIWIDKKLACQKEELISLIKEALQTGSQNEAVFERIDDIQCRGCNK